MIETSYTPQTLDNKQLHLVKIQVPLDDDTVLGSYHLMKEWCKDQFGYCGTIRGETITYSNYYFYFHNEDSATHFKLVWG